MADKMVFFNNCVNWPMSDVDAEGGLSDMVDNAEEISRGEFLREVDHASLARLERELGYNEDLAMKDDWHVTYHVSRHHGERVLYFQHSGIEYVFKYGITEGDYPALRRKYFGMEMPEKPGGVK